MQDLVQADGTLIHYFLCFVIEKMKSSIKIRSLYRSSVFENYLKRKDDRDEEINNHL